MFEQLLFPILQATVVFRPHQEIYRPTLPPTLIKQFEDIAFPVPYADNVKARKLPASRHPQTFAAIGTTLSLQSDAYQL
jgi:hypothetical protein